MAKPGLPLINLKINANHKQADISFNLKKSTVQIISEENLRVISLEQGVLLGCNLEHSLECISTREMICS
jgi:hypothetical protein